MKDKKLIVEDKNGNQILIEKIISESNIKSKLMGEVLIIKVDKI